MIRNSRRRAASSNNISLIEPLSYIRRLFQQYPPKAATPALPGPGGIKPALLFGKPIDQPIEEQPHLGA
jgi:hypothetical protein